MKSNARKNPAILLLTIQPDFFSAAREILEMQEFEIWEAWQDDAPDAVILDSFFLHAGAAEFFHRQKPDLPILWAASPEEENSGLLERFSIDETIRFERPSRIFDWRHAVEEAFEQSQYLRILQSARHQFGSGLWALLMSGSRESV